MLTRESAQVIQLPRATCSDPRRRSRRPEIKLRQLRYFLAGAKHLHFSKAAEAEFVTQSTLSHQIAELETQIGQPLFDRSAKSVRLTEAGEVFKVYATRVVHEVDAGCSALLDLDNLAGGTLRIGATQSFAQRYLGCVLGEFVVNHPGVQLHVQELAAPQIEQQLCSGQLDLGIAFTPATRSDIKAEALREEDLVLVTGPQHSLHSSTSVRLAELQHESLALLSGDHLSRREIDNCFRMAGAAPRVVCETNNLPVILDLVRCSGIAAIVPRCIAEMKPELHMTALTDPTPRLNIALLRACHHHESAAARAMSAALRAKFAATPTRDVVQLHSATRC